MHFSARGSSFGLYLQCKIYWDIFLLQGPFFFLIHMSDFLPLTDFASSGKEISQLGHFQTQKVFFMIFLY